jgi:hypothetical protein
MCYLRYIQGELSCWVGRVVRAQFEKKKPLTSALFLSVLKGIKKHRNLPRDTNIRNYCLLECFSAQETRDFQQSRAVINHRIRHKHIMMPLAL